MAFDLQVFNKQTHLALTETVDQDIEKFNQASGGVITCKTPQHKVILTFVRALKRFKA